MYAKSTKRMLVALAAGTLATLSLGSGVAHAGELTGNGKPLTINANSLCVFSGLEDFDLESPVQPGVVQNWGHTKDAPVIVASRGASSVTLNFGGDDIQEGCNAHLYPAK